MCIWYKLFNKKNKINMQQTIIFGAGASVPYFEPRLNTSYLTKKVLIDNK